MSLPLDEATRVWASKKFEIPLDKIDRVSIEHSQGYDGCDTCGYGGECDFDIYITFVKGYQEDGRNSRHESVYDFSVLLKELLDAE
jgi:hypothetical protein